MNPFKRSTSNLELIHFGREGNLSSQDQKRFDQLMKSDPAEKAHHEEILKARSLLSVMPMVEPRKNFTLSARLAGVRPPKPAYFFAIRSSIALLGIFFISLSLYRFTPFIPLFTPAPSAELSAAPAMDVQAEPMALSAPVEESAQLPIEDNARLVSPIVEAEAPMAKEAPAEKSPVAEPPTSTDWAAIVWRITLSVLLLLVFVYLLLGNHAQRAWKNRNL